MAEHGEAILGSKKGTYMVSMKYVWGEGTWSYWAKEAAAAYFCQGRLDFFKLFIRHVLKVGSKDFSAKCWMQLLDRDGLEGCLADQTWHLYYSSRRYRNWVERNELHSIINRSRCRFILIVNAEQASAVGARGVRGGLRLLMVVSQKLWLGTTLPH